MPADPYLISFFAEVKKPLYTTSANKVGILYLNPFEEIYGTFGSDVSLYVKGDMERGALPSTILDISGERYKIVRQGALDISKLIGNI